MSKPIADDHNAVNPGLVASIAKPYNDAVLYLTVHFTGVAVPVCLWFSTIDTRDAFYKACVAAMGS